MRVAAITYGTEGDTRPFVALAGGLRRAGHSMVLATDPGALPPGCAARDRVELLPLHGSIRDQLAMSPMGDHVRSGAGFVAGTRVVRRLLRDHLADWTRTFVEIAADADVLVSSGLALPVAFNAADRLHLPVTLAAAQPFEPTRDFTLPILGHDLPRALRVPLGRLAGASTWMALRPMINTARDTIGLPPRRRAWTGFPQLIAVSPTLVPRPPDWPSRITVTGDWRLPVDIDYRPPDRLASFLALGEAPVYVGFGSMPVGQDTITAVLAGLDGRRAVLAGGWASIDDSSLPEGVLRIDHAPHDWLMPRVSVAIHHAGAGTSHAACRAGVPSVPVPFTADQPFWAARMRGLGVATNPLPARRVSSDGIRRAVGEAVHLTDAAHRVAALMSAEDGVTVAVRALEELVEG
ncbi:MAG: glycosyltransferase [Micrococcales bacterium]|nr:glycosyltransferase [Micrococcales bacterium]